MNGSYDEDLSSNKFFVDFQNEYADLFHHCVSMGWVVCVPRAGKACETERDDVLAHVLVPDDELPGARYFSLARQPLAVTRGFITGETSLRVRILFEETFYTEDNVKYKVWCVDSPLNRPCEAKSDTSAYCSLSTLRDCIDFLRTETDGREVMENIDVLLREFKNTQKCSDNLSLNNLRDSVNGLYENCLCIAFDNTKLKNNAKKCHNFKRSVKLSVETYMHYGIHDELFDAIISCFAFDDSRLNKITRNLTNFHLRDLDVGEEFDYCIPVAKMCLSQIVKFKTVLGKTMCLKNAIASIAKKKSDPIPECDINYLSPDELLPILIFLIIKSGLPNWHAQLNFMKYFRCSENFIQSDDTSYAISTLEAVIEHLKSGVLCESSLQKCLELDNECGENIEMISYKKKIKTKRISESESDDILSHLFKNVKLSNYEEVKKVLTHNNASNKQYNFIDTEKSNFSIEEILQNDLDHTSELCHPLCTCSKCNNLISKSAKKVPLIFSRDHRGLTVLHVACIYDEPQIVDLILELGAEIDAADYNGFAPIHYAASKGHQNALLLLLHSYADVNKENLERNTALHLATNNGHESCVKAIIYYAENSKIIIDINSKNDNGDTPLHLASKWGYESITRLLLEYGANPLQQNKNGKSSTDIAHSSIILKLLQSNGICLKEYVNINLLQNVAKIVDYNSKKSNVTLLKLPKDEASSKNVKTQSVNALKEMERLFRAIKYGDVKLACFYMAIDINDVDKKSEKRKYCHPLCSCERCKAPSTSVSKYNVNTCDVNGNTALHVAAKYGHPEMCSILLSNNASLNIRNKYGSTPMHIAAGEKKADVSKMLIEHGTNLDIKDSKGNTPLHLACISGCNETVKLILNERRFTQIYNSSGKTPLDEAKDRMFLTIMALFDDFDIS